MSAAWILKNLIASLLLPPGNLLLLLLPALVLFRRRGLALALVVLAALGLYAQSIEIVADLLVAPLERRAGPPVAAVDGARAIVVLGGGRDLDAPEYGGDTASTLTLVRLRYGAMLARRYGLPVLVSGGTAGFGTRTEAAVMTGILQGEFGVPVRWREERSADSAENAEFSAAMLRQDGIRRVLLVTHAFHMPRARTAFERHGIEVVPAPTGYFYRGGVPTLMSFVPQAGAQRVSAWALHEWIGMVWYELVALLRA